MNRSAKKLAAGHLFNVDKEAKKLQEAMAQLFHHLVEQRSYFSRHTRQDIQTAETFLCTRVKAPDEYNYKKLFRVIQYIHGTKELTLMIELGKHPSLWVDSSYTVQQVMLSHGGIIMALGKGETC